MSHEHWCCSTCKCDTTSPTAVASHCLRMKAKCHDHRARLFLQLIANFPLLLISNDICFRKQLHKFFKSRKIYQSDGHLMHGRRLVQVLKARMTIACDYVSDPIRLSNPALPRVLSVAGYKRWASSKKTPLHPYADARVNQFPCLP